MNIYIRNDLNMRKGKIASQSAHAYMKILREYFINLHGEYLIIKDEKYRTLINSFNPFDNENFEKYVSNIKIIPVKSETELNELTLNKNNLAKIIDSGFTEFNGIKTLTCIGELDIAFKNNFHNNLFKNDLNTNNTIKQVLIVNSDLKQNKFELAPYAAFAYISAILAYYNTEEINYINEEIKINLKKDENKDLISYLFGNFKKITLKANTNEIEELKNILKDNKITKYNELKSEKHHSICFSPNNNDFFEKYTSHFKLY